jgi:Domain of unknown function (DUF4907)
MTSTMAAFFKKWGLSILMVVGIASCVWFGLYRRHQYKKEHVLVELKAIQTPLGWGYDILTDGHPYIHQDIIPDIKGQHGFRTREDALAVGQKVYDKLVQKQLPIISIVEMRQMGIYLPDSSNLKK